jgi:hypothetical protein
MVQLKIETVTSGSYYVMWSILLAIGVIRRVAFEQTRDRVILLLSLAGASSLLGLKATYRPRDRCVIPRCGWGRGEVGRPWGQWIGDVLAEMAVPVRRTYALEASFGEEAEDEREPLTISRMEISPVGRR